jgi:hypothetical protein
MWVNGILAAVADFCPFVRKLGRSPVAAAADDLKP